jgi:hypothetical protein
MASSSYSGSGLYKCPTDPCGAFNNLKDFFSKTHLEKHEYRCPMSDCPGKPTTSYNFKVHWMRIHLEHFGLQEERQVCNICGESYPKGNKFNHERRHPTRLESTKRRRDHADVGPAAPVPKNNTGLSDLDMHLIPFNTNFAGTNDETFQGNVQAVLKDPDWPDYGHFPESYMTFDFEQPEFMLAVLENTGSHPPVIDRYRLDQRRYEPALAGSRTIFTYSQEVAVKRFAPGMTPQNITVLRQWLRKVELLRKIRAKRFWRLRIVDQRIDIDAPLVKSTRIIRVSKFHISDHISIHTDRFKMFEHDHPAFVYCKQGHWQELNEMLSKKEVTVADVNPHGQTLLHVSKILLTLPHILDIEA